MLAVAVLGAGDVDPEHQRRCLAGEALGPIGAAAGAGVRFLGGEAGEEHPGGAVVEPGERQCGPEGRAGIAARAKGHDADEGVARTAVVANGELDVGVLGFTGEADESESPARPDLVAGPDPKATPLQVAVLGLPTVAVVDDDGVARLAALDRGVADLADARVGHAVADGLDDAVRCRDDGDTPFHRRKVGHAKIGAGVAFEAEPAAGLVHAAGTGIVVDALLEGADRARLAGDREIENGRPGQGQQREGEKSDRHKKTRPNRPEGRRKCEPPSRHLALLARVSARSRHLLRRPASPRTASPSGP